MNESRRLQLVREVLGSADPGAHARALARGARVPYGRLWSWVLEEGERVAAQRLRADGLIALLLDDGERARLLAEVAADRTRCLGDRLDELLPRCPATPEQLRRLIALLPADGSLDLVLHHPEVPEDLLLELVDRQRCIEILGIGPARGASSSASPRSTPTPRRSPPWRSTTSAATTHRSRRSSRSSGATAGAR